MATPADRQRRYRKRQARGLAVYRVPVGYDVIEALIESGRLAAEVSEDRTAVEREAAAILAEWAFKYFVMRNA